MADGAPHLVEPLVEPREIQVCSYNMPYIILISIQIPLLISLQDDRQFHTVLHVRAARHHHFSFSAATYVVHTMYILCCSDFQPLDGSAR